MKLFQKIVTMAALLGGMTAGAQAQVLLGTFQSATDPTDYGWFDATSGDSITNDANSSFVAAGVPGYANSLQITGSGGFGNPSQLELKLSTPQIEDLLANSYITFTFAVPASSATGGYNQIANLQFQFWQAGYSSGYGSTNLPWSNATSQGDTANNSSGEPNYYFPYSGNPAVVYQTVTVNYSSLLPAIQAGLNSGNYYLNIEFQGNTGGGSPLFQDFNDVELSEGPYGSTPGAYTEDDFNTNGVSPLNPVGDDYYAAGAEPYDVPGNIGNVYIDWIGNGSGSGPISSFTFDPNLNVSGNTNQNGAMAINLTWNGPATDGYQQFNIWHGNANTYVPTVAGGATGISWPTYTNVECDVKFDPSSVTNANGDYGVIRVGIRGVGLFGQDWLTYTTITDTNWHHINGALLASDANAGNIADALIGEDVNASVGNGGLTGNQVLYVDNIKFTGPLSTAPVPPPTLGSPTKASPGLRVFAGPTSTDDREGVYTEDQNQSWVDPGAHFPVSYSFSLLDLNPNIAQTMLEIIAGGSETPTSNGEYDDYSGPTTLWLTLAPGPAAGEVVANVQWKVNDPGANPTNTAVSFTNSTAIGTWSLVFTGDNAGYVVAPGSVVVGSTNFTIADPNVTTDFQDPGFVVIGNQPNTGAGEGTFEDFGFIGITNVVDGNEYENFTTESSDFVANISPSGKFNSSTISEVPAAVIIQTTNDAWWVNWTQPAINYSLASITNLAATNWINPGWYSGYTDTNAPRVMAASQAFGGKYWVLLPEDDLPTANGQQNASPPAASPAAINAFFRLQTNTISP